MTGAPDLGSSDAPADNSLSRATINYYQTISVEAGRDANLAIGSHGSPSDIAAEVIRQLTPHLRPLASGAAVLHPSDGGPSPEPFDAFLNGQIDAIRDRAKALDGTEALERFTDLLRGLPYSASPVIRFRVKANIGLCHLRLGNPEEASKWLLEAYDHAPNDPRAIGNKVLGLWIAGSPKDAHSFGTAALASDPGNELAASYIVRVTGDLPAGADPLSDIPEELRDRETVLLGEVAARCRRGEAPLWWERARYAVKKYPQNDELKAFAAFAEVDEVSQDPAVQQSRELRQDQRAAITLAAEVLDADWRSRKGTLSRPFDNAVANLTAAMVAFHLSNQQTRALELIEVIVDQRIEEPGPIANALQVAFDYNRRDLIERLLRLAPNDPDLAFFHGSDGL